MSRERFHLLTPEQRVIAEKWEQEREAREKLVEDIRAGKVSWKEVGEILRDTTPSMCEHDRSIWSHCISCEEIERIIRPEAFQNEEEE